MSSVPLYLVVRALAGFVGILGSASVVWLPEGDVMVGPVELSGVGSGGALKYFLFVHPVEGRVWIPSEHVLGHELYLRRL